MKPHDLKSMSVEELWSLQELVASVLARKISAEKARLDERLRRLDLDGVSDHVKGMSRTLDALTRRFFRSIETPPGRPRLGRAAGNSHAG